MIGARFPKEIAHRVRADALRLDVSVQDWLTHAAEKLLNQPIESRRASLAGAGKKVTGRKVKM